MAVLLFLLKSFGGTILAGFLKSLERMLQNREALATREDLGRETAVNELNTATAKQKAAVEAQAGIEPTTDAVLDSLDKGTF